MERITEYSNVPAEDTSSGKLRHALGSCCARYSWRLCRLLPVRQWRLVTGVRTLLGRSGPRTGLDSSWLRAGEISLQHTTVAYRNSPRSVLTDFTLHIPAGQKVVQCVVGSCPRLRSPLP